MYLMSDVYAIKRDNLDLVKIVDDAYEANNHYVEFYALPMGKMAVNIESSEIHKVSSELSFEQNFGEQLAKIKYLPTTRPNIVRINTDEKTSQVVNVETEQRSFGFCFIDKNPEQKWAYLTIPRNLARTALLEVFDKDELDLADN